MLFVNINYRVGPFGFLAGNRVQKDGDLNVGMLDQRAALEWVQQHISSVSEINGPVLHVVTSHVFFSLEGTPTGWLLLEPVQGLVVLPCIL